jgi:hypothetical protein
MAVQEEDTMDTRVGEIQREQQQYIPEWAGAHSTMRSSGWRNKKSAAAMCNRQTEDWLAARKGVLAADLCEKLLWFRVFKRHKQVKKLI